MSGDGYRGASEAERAVAHLTELVPDVRGCAVLDQDGRVLAASGPPEGWRVAAAELLAAADVAGGDGRPGPATQVHVGIEDGEAFAVRHTGLAMVAVAERFTLASLVLFDMRTILRDLANGGVVDRRAAGVGDPAGARERARAA